MQRIKKQTVLLLALLLTRKTQRPTQELPKEERVLVEAPMQSLQEIDYDFFYELKKEPNEQLREALKIYFEDVRPEMYYRHLAFLKMAFKNDINVGEFIWEGIGSGTFYSDIFNSYLKIYIDANSMLDLFYEHLGK